MSDIQRQQWLRDVADSLAPEFAAHGKPLPANIRLTVGFPSRGGTRQRIPRVIGEIHDASRSDDGHFEIFISPVNADSVTVAAGTEKASWDVGSYCTITPSTVPSAPTSGPPELPGATWVLVISELASAANTSPSVTW